MATFNSQVNTQALEENHSKRQALLVDVARILMVEHVIERGNPPVRIGDLWSVREDDQTGYI